MGGAYRVGRPSGLGGVHIVVVTRSSTHLCKLYYAQINESLVIFKLVTRIINCSLLMVMSQTT